MAVLRLDRFTIDPADTAEMLTGHAAMVAAVKDTLPGVIDVELAKIETRHGPASGAGTPRRRTGRRRQRGIHPQAGAAFALTKGITVEYAEVVDA